MTHKSYIFVSFELTWFEAERYCERQYNTTLASVITDQDMVQALSVIKEHNAMYEYLWIGMYRYARDQWQWIDSTSCEYVSTGKCIDDVHWSSDQPDSVAESNQFGSYLYYTGDTNLSLIYDDKFGSIHKFLCNENAEKKSCVDEVNCWHQMDSCHNKTLKQNDTTYNTPIIYWNSTIFAFGKQYAHYGNVRLFETLCLSDQTKYYDIDGKQHLLQLGDLQLNTYVRWKQYVYLYERGFDIIRIDLNTMHLENNMHIIETNLLKDTVTQELCFVSDDTHILVVGKEHIAMYSVNTNTWSSKYDYQNAPAVAACSITNNGEFIYKFGYHYEQNVISYNIETETFNYLDVPNLCWLNRGTAVTALNNKIYIHGCGVSSWKTLIFDPITEQFETSTITIDMPINVDQYMTSSLMIFDDNILLLHYLSHSGASNFYYTITDLISINFADTTNTIWPTDDFTIKYYLNDFTNVSLRTYNVSVYCNDTANTINTSIILNISNDNCIYGHSWYNCHHCQQHFNLKNYLLMDTETEELRIQFFTGNDLLILPEYISIQLIRCELSFEIADNTLTKFNPFASFSYSLSPSCYSRVFGIYSLNISSLKCGIAKKIVFTIKANESQICQICSIEDIMDNCVYCNQTHLLLQLETSNLSNTKFEILFQSNTADLRIFPSHYTMQYLNIQPDHELDRKLLYLLFLLIVPLILIMIIILYVKKQYMNAFIVDKSLVLIIGISQFDDKQSYLPGVKQNVTDLTELWREKYKYDVCVCNNDTLYSTKSNVIDFIDCHKTRLYDSVYSGVIVHILSHSSENSFTTSDMKQINMEFIHHEIITTAEHADCLKLVKLIFHHGCKGNADYSIPSVAKSNLLDVNTAGHHKFRFKHSYVQNMKVNDKKQMSYDSNLVIISGNILGRSLSDSGHFTKCICEAFANNLGKILKRDFNSLVVEIGRNLETKTNSAELCNTNGTIRYDQIRFEKCIDIDVERNANSIDVDIQMVDTGRSQNVIKSTNDRFENHTCTIHSYDTLADTDDDNH
eukprot:366698_1